MEINSLKLLNNKNKSKFCYILLKPDVIIGNLLKDILNFFENINLELIDYRCGKVNNNLYKTMYKSSFKWKLDFWEHNAKVYKFGPAIGMAFWMMKIPKNYACAQNYLVSLKGNTFPEKLKPGTLRYKFKSSNRVFNLMHIPDNLSQGLAEGAVWFGSNISKLIKRKGLDKYAELINKEINRHGYLYDRKLDGWLTYILLKIRLLHAIKKQLQWSSKTLKGLEDYYYKTSRKILSTSKTKSESKNLVLSFSPEENNYLKAIIKKRKELKQLLKIIIEVNNRKRKLHLSTLEFFWFLMSDWKVYISNLEKYLIKSVLIYSSR